MIQRAASASVSSPASASEEASPGVIGSAFLALASQRTTSLLVIVLAAFVAIAAFVPQGREALELARDPNATMMHQLAAWRLTDIFDSAWMHALAALLVANLAAMALATLLRERSDEHLRPPSSAPLSEELRPEEPEHAAMTLRELFRSGFGVPVKEDVEGARVTMVFDTSQSGRLAPMATHIGLIVLVLGAALIGRPVDNDRSIARAFLDVRDTKTGKVGDFDMVAGETFTFFQWPSKYSLRFYVPSYEGLGPAIQIARSDNEGRQEAFWVFQRAPLGFDKRHRNGEVEIVARWMGLVPPPGQGLASQPGAILLVFGLGLLVFGSMSSRRPEGRLWLEAEGDRVRFLGVPRARADRAFAKMFDRWKLLARSVLVED